MSEQTTPAGVPAWTLGWRMRRALDHAGISVQEMADYLEMSRSQLSRYLNDKGEAPKRRVLVAWALRCKVDLDWLTYGPEGQDSRSTRWYGVRTLGLWERRSRPDRRRAA